MIILTHVIIALLSLIFASLSVIRPTRRILGVNYAFIAGTVVSGTYLVIVMPAHLVSACVSGLTYIAIATVLTIVAQVRLVRSTTL